MSPICSAVETFLIKKKQTNEHVFTLQRCNLCVVQINSSVVSLRPSQGQACIPAMAVLDCLQHTLRTPGVTVTYANELWKDNFLCLFFLLNKLQPRISTK